VETKVAYLTREEAEQWIDGLAAFDHDNEILFLTILAAFGKPDSYLDIGSGDGAMVNTATKLGIESIGLDQLPRTEWSNLHQVDLREPQYLNKTFQLVTSIETAEHIEPEYADIFIDTITRHANGMIIFTAAMPGQQGHGHYNCQPAYYWREKFYKRGWNYSEADTTKLVAMMALAFHGSHHVEANMQVFRREGAA
jgi:cyclopropane fatty-acyl-phospholipid synthase-like methyltransferase